MTLEHLPLLLRRATLQLLPLPLSGRTWLLA
jgi:hypothetical protein